MTPREGVWALLKEARDGLQLDADERKQQLASLGVARPGMFDALVYNDTEIKRNRALVARIDASLAHPAATAREEALAEGLAQAAAACQSRALEYEGQAGEWNANAKAYACRECARAIHAMRRALALARSTGGA